MAGKKDWRRGFRCAVGKRGEVQPDKAARGMCFVIERVKRNGHDGFVTAMHNRATGRRVAYSAPSGGPGFCRVTPDPFQAEVRGKGPAVSVGAACAKKMSSPPTMTALRAKSATLLKRAKKAKASAGRKAKKK